MHFRKWFDIPQYKLFLLRELQFKTAAVGRAHVYSVFTTKVTLSEGSAFESKGKYLYKFNIGYFKVILSTRV